MSEVALDEVRRLCEAATRGPWIADGSEIYSEFHGGPWVGETLVDDEDATRANSAFIATARELVPELAAEVARLRAERDRLRAELAGYRAAAGLAPWGGVR